MPAIIVDDLWKEYRYGQLGYGTLRHDLESWWAGIRGKPDPNAKLADEREPRADRGRADRFWALRGVSFEVERGGVLGVIGRNGAGKSTLLKIMSRVTSPTRGSIRLRGRLASLLEVGTGFHPDLSGRENVFLNGAILGMTRAEVARKFDEIVAFAEVEKFIDTPVKRYSSGMYVRLAFAVAAHLEPEVLVVDEVLAVGDVAFQGKCLGKMKEVSGEGRTVLFVSHNMGAITSLCGKALLLSSGQLVAHGKTAEVVDAYLDSTRDVAGADRLAQAKGIGRAWLADAYVSSQGQKRVEAVQVQNPFRVHLEVACQERVKAVEVGVRVERQNGQRVFTTGAAPMDGSLDLEPGETHLSFEVPGGFLAPDVYYLTVAIHRPNVEILASHDRLLKVHVLETGSGMWKYSDHDFGCVLVTIPWRIGRDPGETTGVPGAGRGSAEV